MLKNWIEAQTQVKIEYTKDLKDDLEYLIMW